MKNKRFDPKLFKKHDQPAKKAAKEIFESLGFKVNTNPDKYAADLLVNKGNIELKLEVERKTLWKETEFPFKDLNIPARKAKLFSKDCPTLFVIFNNTFTKYLCIYGNDLRVCKKEQLSNRYMSNETFFKIDLLLTFDDVKKALRFLPESDYTSNKKRK